MSPLQQREKFTLPLPFGCAQALNRLENGHPGEGDILYSVYPFKG